MNYNAHIHLAELSNTSLLGNFLGDFVKGRDYESLPLPLQQGVKLHRAIDSYTDNHVLVKELKALFPSHLRRMSGVCIDIWFDHLLLQFNEQHPPILSGLVWERFYTELAHFDYKNGRFTKIKASLLHDRWLNVYHQQANCLTVFKSIERRLNGRIQFAHESFEFMKEHSDTLKASFACFYPELMLYSKHQALAMCATKQVL